MIKSEAIRFERITALSANYYHIKRWVEKENLGMSENEILRAARWNYKKFGFGKVSLDDYLNRYAGRQVRLYDINIKEWYRLLAIVFKRDNYTCAYCGEIGKKFEGDHIIPISKGGTNELSNLTTACRKCNRQKKDKLVSEFLEWRVKNG